MSLESYNQFTLNADFKDFALTKFMLSGKTCKDQLYFVEILEIYFVKNCNGNTVIVMQS